MIIGPAALRAPDRAWRAHQGPARRTSGHEEDLAGGSASLKREERFAGWLIVNRCLVVAVSSPALTRATTSPARARSSSRVVVERRRAQQPIRELSPGCTARVTW
jgi:hypothetical protein